MFSRLLKYRLIETMRTWQVLFWNLVFPIALSSFLYLAMGSMIHPEQREPLPVQVDDARAAEVLEEIEFEGVQMYTLVKEADPEQAVKDGTILAYVKESSPPEVFAKEREIEAETLGGILLSIDRGVTAVEMIMEEDPTQDPEAIIEQVTGQSSLFEESGEDTKLMLTNFFYTVIAMVCLGAITLGVANVFETEAQFSSMGRRLGIVPHSKATFLLPFTVASLLFNTVIGVIAVLYINFVLGIPFGDNIPAILLTIVVGSLFGLSIGMVIGFLVRGSLDARINVGVGFYIFSSFLAGMMSLGVKQLITLHAPFVHKINPSSLLTNTLSSLYYFDHYRVFRENLMIIGAMTAVLLVIVLLLARRNQYEYV